MFHICIEGKSVKPPDYVTESVYAFGGKGNSRLIGFSYTRGSIEDKISLHKESEIIKQNQLVVKQLFNYYDESNHPKEWSNIEKGSDLFKLTKRDKRFILGCASLLLMVVGLIVGYIL